MLAHHDARPRTRPWPLGLPLLLLLAGCPEEPKPQAAPAPAAAGAHPELTVVRMTGSSEDTSALTVHVRNGLEQPIALLGFTVGGVSLPLEQVLRGELVDGNVVIETGGVVPASPAAPLGVGSFEGCALPAVPPGGVWNGYTAAKPGRDPRRLAVSVADEALAGAELVLEYALLEPSAACFAMGSSAHSEEVLMRIEGEPSTVAAAAERAQRDHASAEEREHPPTVEVTLAGAPEVIVMTQKVVIANAPGVILLTREAREGLDVLRLPAAVPDRELAPAEER